MKKLLKNTYFLYTCLFLILLPVVFRAFMIEGKSFVWNIDGVRQHYPMLQYYGKILRDLLMGKGFHMVDFQIGLGFDTIQTLQYYVLGDPLTLLSVFINGDNAVFMYVLIILLRFYLAGISFIIFCKYWKKDGNAVLLGAIIYVFSGFSLYGGIKHPFFLNPMIYLPLLIIGLEEVMRRKKPYVLIIITFFCTMSNFYFFYILSIIAVGYVTFRYVYTFHKSEKNKIVGYITTGLRTGGYYLLGIGMAAFLFFPVVYAFMNNGRLDNEPTMTTGYLHYNHGYYLTLLQGFFAPGEITGYWTELAFASITIVSLTIMFCNKKYRQLRFTFVITMCALLVPMVGFLMNGFSYTTNRWSFLVALLVAFSFTMTYEKFLELSKKEFFLLAVLLVGYGIIAYGLPAHDIVKWEFVVLLITVIIIGILQMNWFKIRQTLSQGILFAIVVITVSLQGYAYYAPEHFGYVKEFLTKDEVVQSTTKGAISLVKDIKDDSFYRVETYGDKAQNEALCMGYRDVSAYYSLMDGKITTYLKQLEVLNQRSAYRFDNIDYRTILDSLSCVKYLVTTKQEIAPYGFSLVKKNKEDGKEIYLYKNSYALPIGYTYDNYILEEDYDKLNAIEKQNAMMYAAVLKKDSTSAIKSKDNITTGIKKLGATITPDDNVILEDHAIKVLKAGAQITFDFYSEPNSETYLRFNQLKLFKGIRSMGSIRVKGQNGATKYVNVRSIYYSSYFGKENYLVNVGYNLAGSNQIIIKFPERKKYSYESMDLYSVDMGQFNKRFQELSNNALKNEKIDNNLIEGDITLDKKGVMVFSIPYSKGFHAYVDNKKVDIVHANVMYMGVPLDPGNHHIVLKYETPYLKLGGAVSIMASIAFIGIVIYHQKIKK